MRNNKARWPPSPPAIHAAAFLESDGEFTERERPVVYQVHRSLPDSGNYPGGFSPVRTSNIRAVCSSTSPPSASISSGESLYANFVPPRRQPTGRENRDARGSPPDASIFRPKQVIVARSQVNDAHAGNKETTPPAEAMITKSSVSTFPAKLHGILSSGEYREYITWLPHGRGWRILKSKAFEQRVIPKYFRSSKYASFMRQVNGWGFRRITTPGPDFNAYWHELFLRGLPTLCERMKRPNKTKATLERDYQPNFYSVHEFSPLPETQREVDPSSCVSSASCDAVLSDHPEVAKTYACAVNPQSDRNTRSALGSWDCSDEVKTDGMAINLSGVYEREVAGNDISKTELRYLIEQNRALLAEVHLHQARRKPSGEIS